MPIVPGEQNIGQSPKGTDPNAPPPPPPPPSIIQVPHPATIIDIQLQMEVANADLAKFSDFIDAVEYQGFDPMHTNDILINKERVISTRKEEMMFLVATALTRGTKQTKIMTSIKDGAQKEKLRQIILKYNIKDTATISDKRNDITLARICATLPIMCVQANMVRMAKGLQVETITGYPDQLQFPAAGALISKFNRVWRRGYIRWTRAFAKKIKVKPNPAMVNMMLTIGTPLQREQMYNMTCYMLGRTGIKVKYSNGRALVADLSPTTMAEAKSIATEVLEVEMSSGDDDDDDDDDADRTMEEAETSKKRKT